MVYGRVIADGSLGAVICDLPDPAVGADGKVKYPPETPTLQVLGWYKTFCPVALHRMGALVPGSKACAASFRGMVYLMASEEARAAFVHNPSFFAVAPEEHPAHRLASGSLPAPLVMLIGPDGSGRDRLASDLAEANNLLVIPLASVLPLSRPRPPPSKELGEGEKEPPFDPEWTESECLDMCKALKIKLASPPYAGRGVVLEGVPLSDKLTAAALSALLHPVAAFFVSLEDADAVSRLYGMRDLAYPKPHRLPFYPFLDAHVQRRDMRILKALGIEPPNPHPRDEEGKPVEPKPTDEQLKEAALAAEEQVKGLITTKNQGFAASAAAMKAALEVALVPVRSINASSAYARQLSSVSGVLAPFLAHSASAMASPIAITPDKAVALLELGRRRYSKFGMACPVSLLESGRRLGPGVMSTPNFPVLFGPCIYFCRGEVQRRRMIADPVKHVQQPEAQPRASQRVCVVGPPKSGKTRVAEQAARELGVEVLTAASCVSEVMGEVSQLGAAVRGRLYAGQELDEGTLSRAIVAACRRRCAWVLDGFPVTPSQLEAMEAAGLELTTCITLGCPDAVVVERADAQLAERGGDGLWAFPRPGYTIAGDPSADPPREEVVVGPLLPVLGGEAAVHRELKAWRKGEEGVFAGVARVRDVRVEVDGEWGKARAGQEVRRVLRAAEEGRQAYLAGKVLKRASPMRMQHMWVHKAKLEGARGSFSNRVEGQGDYCPVCWREKGDLVLCSEDRELSHMVEFGDRYYVGCSPACLNRLLAAAARYTKEEPPLPKTLPRRLSGDAAAAVKEEDLMYKGYCPVTFKLGPAPGEDVQSVLVKAPQEGPSLVVAFEGEHYRLLDDAKLNLFMRRPHEYTQLKLPVKLPFDKAPVKVETLPLIGYLEETVVDSMQSALVDVGRRRPRFPCTGNKESALVYLSLYLRAHNKSNSVLETERRHKITAEYLAACELLTRDCG